MISKVAKERPRAKLLPMKNIGVAGPSSQKVVSARYVPGDVRSGRREPCAELAELASNEQVRSELGEHADNRSDSHFPLDA